MGGGGASSRWTRRSTAAPRPIPRAVARRASITNSAHKNVILSLVERGGSVRSYHVAGSTDERGHPHRQRQRRQRGGSDDGRAPSSTSTGCGDFASHDRVDHSKDEYVRYEEGRPVIHTNTVEGYFGVFKRGMRGTYQHCKEKHLHRYLRTYGASAPSHNHGLDLMWSLVDVLIRGVSR